MLDLCSGFGSGYDTYLTVLVALPLSLGPHADMTTDGNNRKAFLQAAQDGDLATLEEHLESGMDINYKAPWPDGDEPDGRGAPAIVEAAMYGHLAAVRMLADRGADIDKNEFPLCSVSASLIASTDGFVEIVRLLVARGAKAETEVFQGTTTPLGACAGNSLSRLTE